MEYEPGRYPDWSDTPTEVLIDILEKWKSAIRKGWYPSLWTKCALCREHEECYTCPITPYWCEEGSSRLSRLSRMGFMHRSPEEWEANVKEFVENIEKEIERREET